MREIDLYNPVKILLEKQGFNVKGEVGAVDVFGMNGETIVAVELKTQVSLKLVYQAIERQKITDYVYIAISKQALMSHKSSSKSLVLLLKRLSIGLIVVEQQAKVILEARDNDLSITQKRNKRKRIKVVKEFRERVNNYNIGGTKGKIVTAYREKVIQIARLMSDGKIYTPLSLKKNLGYSETGRILQKNYYKWFIRVKRGQYILSEVAKIELKTYLDKI